MKDDTDKLLSDLSAAEREVQDALLHHFESQRSLFNARERLNQAKCAIEKALRSRPRAVETEP